MKLQVSFDYIDIDKALEIAKKIEPYVDIFEIGTLLIYSQGSSAVEKFRKSFPNKTLLADSKIVDRGKEATNVFLYAGADWVTVMAGTNNQVIATVAQTAHKQGKKVMLDLIDSDSYAQSALDAANLGVDAIMYHMSHDQVNNQPYSFIETWNLVRENTKLPIYIAPRADLSDVESTIKKHNPAGLIIGSAICEADDPAAAEEKFANLIKDNR